MSSRFKDIHLQDLEVGDKVAFMVDLIVYPHLRTGIIKDIVKDNLVIETNDSDPSTNQKVYTILPKDILDESLKIDIWVFQTVLKLPV